MKAHIVCLTHKIGTVGMHLFVGVLNPSKYCPAYIHGISNLLDAEKMSVLKNVLVLDF